MTEQDNIIMDMRDYFAGCAKNAAKGSAARNRFEIYCGKLRELLEKEKPLKPVAVEDTKYYWCGACREYLRYKSAFCPNCGRRVKWDG